MEFTSGCDENGKLTAIKAVIVADTGAYASLGGPVLQRACTHASGPYNYQNIDIHGFGVTQSCFAVESNINQLAEKVGISPWEIRWRNAIRPGETLGNGQIAGSNTAMAEALMAVKETYEANPKAGLACAFKNSGIGVGNEDAGRVILSVQDGKIHIRTSAACMGQGVGTVCLQIVCEDTGLSPELMVVERPDTRRTPDAGTSTASRQTVLTGQAVHQAAIRLTDDLNAGKSLADLEGKEYFEEFYAETDPMGSEKQNPVSHISYSYGAAVVLLDEAGKVSLVEAAYDVGTPINLQAIEGQIEGGIAMGLGIALTEDYPMKDGWPQAKYGTLGLLRAPDVPPIKIHLVKAPDDQLSPYAHGAKGIGELSLIPITPACQNAYYNFDGEFRTELPMKNTFYKKKK